MIVTSHRGAGFLEPENTLRAIRRAIELGADQVEIDVHLTRDGRLVLMHDATVDRTTNGAGIIAGLSLDEIRLLDAGLGERVPTLEEALELANGKITSQIELKGSGTAFTVVQALTTMGCADKVVLTSFLHTQLQDVRRLDKNIAIGALWGRLPPDVVVRSRQLEAQAMHIWHEFIDGALVRDAHAQGLLVRAWNANTEEEMRRLIDLGVDAIGSDRPDLLLEVCRRAGVR